jgi:hypothetical protein
MEINLLTLVGYTKIAVIQETLKINSSELKAE